MKIFSECNLSEVIAQVNDGGTVVFPTETSYGLGCDATNQKAVDAIFQIKGRSDDKPLLIVVPTVAMAKFFLVWNNTMEKLANAYWPGALTIVGLAQDRSGLARGVISKNNTVAVRVTNNQHVKFLTESLGKPIVATSANISGAGDVYSGQMAAEMFAKAAHQPDIILDMGELVHNQPTTIVDASNDSIKILRQGGIEIKNA